MMRISIIIPVLNESEHIVETLHALSPMREDGAEVIVVDGGSRDGTAHLAAPFADKVITTTRGRANQMNAGASAASAGDTGGDTLLFLHADTRLPSDAIHQLQQGLADTAQAWGRFDVTIEGRPALLRVIAAFMNMRSRITGIATGDQAIFVRRETFFAIGGFPDQPLMEDIEISKRLKAYSKPLCLRTKVVTSGRRWEQNGVFRTMLLMWRLRLQYWLGAPADELAKAYR